MPNHTLEDQHLNSDINDLNRGMLDVQRRSSEIRVKLGQLLGVYENLFRDSHRLFAQERAASGGIAGLGEFYRLVQTIRRNRDIVGSMIRGMSGLRSLEGFRFTIEDLNPKKNSMTKRLRKISLSERSETSSVKSERLSGGYSNA